MDVVNSYGAGYWNYFTPNTQIREQAKTDCFFFFFFPFFDNYWAAEGKQSLSHY